MELETVYRTIEIRRAPPPAGGVPSAGAIPDEGHSSDLLSGVVCPYLVYSRIGEFRERFRPGAFGDISEADCVLNFAHERGRPLARTGGGGLRLVDSVSELRAEFQLPETQGGKDARLLIDRKVIRGLSVEMRVDKDSWEGRNRTIEKATLFNIGLVDRPAHTKSVLRLSNRYKEISPPRGRVKFYL